MIVEQTALPGVLLLRTRRFADERGWFQETFRAEALNAATDRPVHFVQDNHSFSERRGTVRGLHLQRDPVAQAKLVRVASGAVLDVALDVRPGSDTYGRHVAVELSADNGQALFVPEGFAHGFQTLTDGAEVLYKVSAYYAPAAEAGVFWADPALGIDWPVGAEDAVVNEKDRALPLLADFVL